MKKIFGVIFIIVGILVSLLGYTQYADFECNCPKQIVGQPSSCGCVDSPQQYVGHIITYVGIIISGIGIILFVREWKNKKSQ